MLKDDQLEVVDGVLRRLDRDRNVGRAPGSPGPGRPRGPPGRGRERQPVCRHLFVVERPLDRDELGVLGLGVGRDPPDVHRPVGVHKLGLGEPLQLGLDAALGACCRRRAEERRAGRGKGVALDPDLDRRGGPVGLAQRVPGRLRDEGKEGLVPVLGQGGPVEDDAERVVGADKLGEVDGAGGAGALGLGHVEAPDVGKGGRDEVVDVPVLFAGRGGDLGRDVFLAVERGGGGADSQELGACGLFGLGCGLEGLEALGAGIGDHKGVVGDETLVAEVLKDLIGDGGVVGDRGLEPAVLAGKVGGERAERGLCVWVGAPCGGDPLFDPGPREVDGVGGVRGRALAVEGEHGLLLVVALGRIEVVLELGLDAGHAHARLCQERGEGLAAPVPGLEERVGVAGDDLVLEGLARVELAVGTQIGRVCWLERRGLAEGPQADPGGGEKHDVLFVFAQVGCVEVHDLAVHGLFLLDVRLDGRIVLLELCARGVQLLVGLNDLCKQLGGRHHVSPVLHRLVLLGVHVHVRVRRPPPLGLLLLLLLPLLLHPMSGRGTRRPRRPRRPRLSARVLFL